MTATSTSQSSNANGIPPIDDTPSTRRADVKTARNYLVAALDEIAAGKPVTIAATRAYGCSIKYKTS